MSSQNNVLIQARDGIETLDLQGFRKRVVGHLQNGERLVSLFGTPVERSPAPLLHAVVLLKEGKLCHFQGRVAAGETYQSLSAEFPQAHCFEREIHEQYGLAMPEHPWLKPIRFEGANLKRMNDYPFYQIAGKEVHEVGVGPIHAGVIEPGHFRFMCFGEKVHHLEIHLGYQHRGVEALLAKAKPRGLPPLVESIAGDSSVGYILGFCRAYEALSGVEADAEVEKIRALALELERIAMHLVGLGGLATDVAFLPGSSTYGRLRTSVINLSMRMCGSRFGRSWFRPGELRFAFTEKHKEDARKTLGQVREDIGIINQLFRKSRSVRHRLATTGTVTPALAHEIGLVGMAGRASGQKTDTRHELRAGAYRNQPMPLVVEESGDCWARGLVRIREIDASIEWIFQLLETLGEVPAGKRVELQPGANQSVVAVEEGWRGEILHHLQTDGTGRISHYKVQDPSIRNWFGLAQAVRDNAIYDFPICNKSFDLSYCGNDL